MNLTFTSVYKRDDGRGVATVLAEWCLALTARN
jgi:hypothetical protein